MLKRVLVAVLIFLAPLMSAAQAPELIVQGASPDLYVVHTVAAKENWYSVGRLFNISPKEIAPANGKTLTTPLNIGEQLKVPLTAANFSQNNTKAGDEVFVPVYHVVQDKEWMFRISSAYNKVPVENLEKWNNLGKDGAKAGTKLIVGFLKVKKDQGVAGVTPPVVTQQPVATSQPATSPAPQTQKPVTSTAQQTVPGNQPVTTPASKPVTTTTQQPVETMPKATLPPATTPSTQTVVAGDSYFKGLYEPSGKSASGNAGVFKSMSGWQDKKFYALMNGVSTGTIIRITNPSTGRLVFAKVLGQLPDMQQSSGLAIRLSDAAAADLGATATKFSVQIAY
jgi:LysM repeat protein